MNASPRRPLPDSGGALDGEIGRRRFVQRMLNATLGLWVVSAAVGATYVAGRYLWPHPEGARTGVERDVVVPLAQLDESPLVKILVQGKAVGVYRYDGVVHATSLICSHLGCLVDWVPSLGEFHCPCHGSIFDHNGGVLRGPAPKPLPRHDVRVAGDRIVVS